MNAFANLAQLISSQIVNCFVVGIAVAALAGATSAAVGRKNSGVRFAIWFAGLLAIASLFVLGRPLTGTSLSVHLSAPQFTLRPQWAFYIFGAWALFASVAIGRIVRGLWRVRSLKKTSAPLESSVLASIQQALPRVSRRFEVCTSEQVRVPAALGFLRPMIVLPVWAVRELQPEELSTVVLHESAHLERWDDWTNLLQKIIRAVLFFHPAVWWIDSRLAIEREISCDDMVLARSRSARQYAACLISLAEKTRAHRSLVLAQAAVSRLKQTGQRISKILDGNQRTVKPLLKPAMAALAVFAGFSFVAVQHTPQLVGFGSDREASSHASSADKFDYVANVNPVAVKALPASLHPSSTPILTRTKAQRAAEPHDAAIQARPRPRSVPLESAPTQEAANRTREQSPVVVNAAMSADQTPRFVYLVTQTEQYDGFGNVTVMTSVWRVRVTKPAPNKVQAPVFPHQT
ncbi:MAG TPA: M56 family metallopeptidase [Terriglobales bacterium]|jgi:beta-lactamase regulating signal transducer with metallopeptidase domain|nr:M56 family metallopeptidase [Terriglobales bacterium]